MSVSRCLPETGMLDRDGERAAIDGVLEAARAGRSAVLVLLGEPGIGKTALLDYAAGRAMGFRAVRAWGVVRRTAPVVRAHAQPAGPAPEPAA
jgi:MoxR-like ATPase